MGAKESAGCGNRATGAHTAPTMKALVYHGHGKRAWEEKPRPAIQRNSVSTGTP